jgi:hypothetical protein
VFGVLFALKHLANRVGIPQALGRSRETSLILFLMLARIAHGGSRLSAVRWAASHAVEDLRALKAAMPLSKPARAPIPKPGESSLSSG